MTLATTKRPLKKARAQAGDIVAIPLDEEEFGFGWLTAHGDCIFLDCKARRPFPRSADIVAQPLAFRVPVLSGIVRSGGWEIIGHIIPSGAVARPAAYRNQAAGSAQLYLCRGSESTPASYDEVKDLEVMVWWSDGDVVRRLREHFAGRTQGQR